MSTFQVHTIQSAPEQSKPVLQQIEQTFGFIPNIAGAMSGSPALIDAFFNLFQKVHAGTFSEAQIQTLLLTNAVTNACRRSPFIRRSRFLRDWRKPMSMRSAMAARGREILRHIELARRDVSALTTGTAGHVRLGAVATIPELIIAGSG